MLKTLLIVFISLTLLPAKVPDCNDSKVQSMAQHSEIVAVGKIISISQPPLFWSGQFIAWQQVEYEVDEVLKGKIPEKRIVVAYVIVSGSEIADKEKPQLSAKLFAEGNRQVLSLEPNKNYRFINNKKHHIKVYIGDDICLLNGEDKIVNRLRETINSK